MNKLSLIFFLSFMLMSCSEEIYEYEEMVRQELKANDNKFVLKSHGVGKYGRCLGELFVESLGETSVQETLINEGHGVAYFGGKR